jgi:hypothetical protein
VELAELFPKLAKRFFFGVLARKQFRELTTLLPVVTS